MHQYSSTWLGHTLGHLIGSSNIPAPSVAQIHVTLGHLIGSTNIPAPSVAQIHDTLGHLIGSTNIPAPSVAQIHVYFRPSDWQNQYFTT